MSKLLSSLPCSSQREARPWSSGPKAPETPYLRAKQVWDERLGHTTAQAYNWRCACFLTLLLLIVLSGLLCSIALKRRVIPYVVRVDGDTGRTVVVGRADDIEYQPRQEELRYFIVQLILALRSVPSDPVLLKRNWLWAYRLLGAASAAKVNQEAQAENSPLRALGKDTVQVEPLSVVRIGKGSTYQARWKEARYSEQGALLSRSTMQGVFTLELEPPKREADLLANPLGIRVTEFHWSKELG